MFYFKGEKRITLSSWLRHKLSIKEIDKAIRIIQQADFIFAT